MDYTGHYLPAELFVSLKVPLLPVLFACFSFWPIWCIPANIITTTWYYYCIYLYVILYLLPWCNALGSHKFMYMTVINVLPYLLAYLLTKESNVSWLSVCCLGRGIPLPTFLSKMCIGIIIHAYSLWSRVGRFYGITPIKSLSRFS